MPVLKIFGIEDVPSSCNPGGVDQLKASLKKVIASLPELEITEEVVSPFPLAPSLRDATRQDVLYLEMEIYEKEKRTPEVFETLVQKIFRQFAVYGKEHLRSLKWIEFKMTILQGSGIRHVPEVLYSVLMLNDVTFSAQRDGHIQKCVHVPYTRLETKHAVCHAIHTICGIDKGRLETWNETWSIHDIPLTNDQIQEIQDTFFNVDGPWKTPAPEPGEIDKRYQTFGSFIDDIHRAYGRK